MDLVEFLLVRIAEDEAAARAAVSKRVDISANWSNVAVIGHIDRWSSARVLAECEAKRQIVKTLTDRWWSSSEMLNGRLLGFLALPYVDHPDYRQEWQEWSDGGSSLGSQVGGTMR